VKPPEPERHLEAGDAFRRFARTTSSVVGSAKRFMIAEGARTAVVTLEALSDEERVKLQQEFEEMQSRYGREVVARSPIGQELRSRHRKRQPKQV
jgi:hypothetical protein